MGGLDGFSSSTAPVGFTAVTTINDSGQIIIGIGTTNTNTYENFQQLYYTAQEILDGDADPDTDINGDGIHNKTAFALGLNPLVFHTDIFTPLFIEIDGDFYFAVDYTRPIGPDKPLGVVYNHVRSLDLVSYDQPIIVESVIDNLNNTETVTFRSAEPLLDRAFMMLAVELQ
ncbi:MAG: hypothetical protein AAGA18_08000 [Verrucomicrobiota bacterium]